MDNGTESAIAGLSVVIPVYNEPENIPRTLAALRPYVETGAEVIVVYDYDEDSTLPVLRELAPAYPMLRLVRNHVARGPSGALRSGFQAARMSRVLVLMADLCDDLTQIPQLTAMVPAQADVACPSRYAAGGSQELGPSLKVFAPRSAGWLLRGLAGVPTYDPTNSFKMYSAALLANLSLTSTISFSVTLEIVAKAHCLGYRIAEIPTVWRDRQHGKTNFKVGRSLVAYSPWFLAAMARNRLFALPQRMMKRMFSANREQRDTVAGVMGA